MSEGRSVGPLRASTVRSIHEAMERLDHSEYRSRVSRRTSNIEYDAHVLQQEGAEMGASWGVGVTLIESQQSLHQKSDAAGLARRFTPRVFPENRIVSKASRQSLRQLFDVDTKACTEVNGLRDGGDADEVDKLVAGLRGLPGADGPHMSEAALVAHVCRTGAFQGLGFAPRDRGTRTGPPAP